MGEVGRRGSAHPPMNVCTHAPSPHPCRRPTRAPQARRRRPGRSGSARARASSGPLMGCWWTATPRRRGASTCGWCWGRGAGRRRRWRILLLWSMPSFCSSQVRGTARSTLLALLVDVLATAVAAWPLLVRLPQCCAAAAKGLTPRLGRREGEGARHFVQRLQGCKRQTPSTLTPSAADDALVVVRAASRVEPSQSGGQLQLSFTEGFVVDR